MWDLAKTGGTEKFKAGGRRRATLCVRADWTQDSRANLEVMVERLNLEQVLQNLPYPFSVIGDNKVHNECAGNICHRIFAEEAVLLRLQRWQWQCWEFILEIKSSSSRGGCTMESSSSSRGGCLQSNIPLPRRDLQLTDLNNNEMIRAAMIRQKGRIDGR